MVVGPAAAIYEQAVVKSERVDPSGLNPTIYSASFAVVAKRHFSQCGAGLTQ